MNHRTAIPALIALFAPLAAEAAAPSLIPVTGYLTDANGLPIDGAVDIEFKIYRTATGPTAQWNNNNQGPMSVDVFDGQFTAYLGSDGALDLGLFRDNTGLYLGMAVDGGAEMLPRFEIGSAPFAGYAKYCDDANTVGGTDVSQLRMAADPIPWSDLDPTTIPAGVTYSAGTGIGISGTTISANNVPWSALNATSIPAGLSDGDDVGPTYSAGLGIGISGTTISADKPAIEGWARFVAFDTQGELTTALNSVYMAKQTCAANQVLMSDGSGTWSCTDSSALPLSEAVIDGFLANNLLAYATTASVTTLTGRVATAESSIGTLTTQIGTANTNITTLQTQIGGLGTNPGNMIGQYEFDEGTGATSFADTSGLSNTLAATSGGVSPNSGISHSGKSVGFAAVEGIYAAAGNKIADSDQIWPEMWMYTGNPGGTYTLLEKQGAYKLRLASNVITWTVTTTGGTCTVTHSLPIVINTWTHVSAWYDGLNVSIAINGAPQTATCTTGRIAPTYGGVMTIGGIKTGANWSEVFSGYIDEVRIRPTAPFSGSSYYNRAVGGVVSEAANKRIHKFTETGTFTTYVPLVVDALVVGGGGAGGQHSTTNGNGGGGAGGYIYQTSYLVAPGTYQVTVGAGGGAAKYMSWGTTLSKVGSNGGNSTFSTLTAIGGGGGGAQSTGNGMSGGSGGGGASTSNPTPGNGTVGQGNAGGLGNYSWTGGGGGGAGGPGIAGGVCGGCAPSGNGGPGLSNSISGVLTYYAGGGGGGGNSSERAGDGYDGGGRGYGTTTQYNYQYEPVEINATTHGSGTVDAIPNTGGGGGAGSYWNNNRAGNGGSGIVIIRYPI